jgi:hypothetical protein
VLLEQGAHGLRVAILNGAFEALDRGSLRRDLFLDAVLQLAPTYEAVFARQHELRVGERQLGLVRKLGAHAGDCFPIAGAEGL